MTLPSYIKPIFTDKSLSTDGITIVLSTRARVKLGEIHNIDYSSINNTCELINGNSLSFDVYKTLNGEDEPLWDQIMDLKLIYVPELDDYLEITSDMGIIAVEGEELKIEGLSKETTTSLARCPPECCACAW